MDIKKATLTEILEELKHRLLDYHTCFIGEALATHHETLTSYLDKHSKEGLTAIDPDKDGPTQIAFAGLRQLLQAQYVANKLADKVLAGEDTE